MKRNVLKSWLPFERSGGPESLAFVCLLVLLAIVWLAGGASRADALGQMVTRVGTWAVLVFFVLKARPTHFKLGMPLILLVGAALLVAVQLIPLPPGLWTAMPGRDLFLDAADVAGLGTQPWRPISLSPPGTMNALMSLVVPVAAVAFAAYLPEKAQWRIVQALIVMAVLSLLVGLAEFSGISLDHPLINDSAGEASGVFANRNHQALMLAMAIVAVFFVAARGVRRGHFSPAFALGGGGLSIVLMVLVILATGSRAGLALGALALVAGASVFVVPGGNAPKIPRSALLVGAAILIALVVASVVLGRAESFERLGSESISGDAREDLSGVVSMMAATFAPVGSGFGTFDPVFRIAEPDVMLQFRYYNLAHNDFLQVVLEGGVLGALLLVVGIGWWAYASVRAWIAGRGLAVLGSWMLLLGFAASFVDYPARTPIIMALGAIAAVWLAGGYPREERIAGSGKSGSGKRKSGGGTRRRNTNPSQ